MRVASQVMSLSAGQLDDTLEARRDIAVYYAGARNLRNMLGLPTGGQTRRWGLKMVAELEEAANGCELIPFHFKADQTYLIAATDGEFHIYRGDTETKVATETSPLTASELSKFGYCQTLDTLLMATVSHAPFRLMRQGAHDQWAVGDLPLTNLPQEKFGNDWPNTTGTPAATTGTGVTFTAGTDWFSSGDVGATIEGNDGVAVIASYVSATQVTVNITTAFGDTSTIAAGGWSLDMSTATTSEEDAWSDRRGHPTGIMIHDGRLYLSREQTAWGSVAGEYYDFEAKEPINGEEPDDSMVSQSLDGDQVNTIEQIYSGYDLVFLTAGGVFVVEDTPVTPKKFDPLNHTRTRASHVRPVELEGGVCFVMAGGEEGDEHQSVQELVYDDAQKGYVTNELSQLCASLIRNPEGMAKRHGNKANSAHHIFVNNADGTVAVLNTRRSQKITGWTWFDTEGEILRTAVVGNKVFFLVKRTIDGTDRYFIERLEEGYFLDCSIKQTSGTPKTAWTGFEHLAGETVALWGDGADLGNAEVQPDGSVTTPFDVSELEAGFSFTWEVEPMPIEAQLENGTLVGNKHRITKVTVEVYETVQLKIRGKNAIHRRFGGASFDQAPQPYTGRITKRLLGWNDGTKGETVPLSYDRPGPATILGITVEVAT